MPVNSSTKKPIVLVAGAGQIGCRHLQSIATSGVASELWIVDPAPHAERLVEARLTEAGVTDWRGIRLSRELDGLPARLDVAIIATNSLVRSAVLKELLVSSRPDHVILEKFLFPRAADYSVADALLRKMEVTAFVNCPRRLFHGYRRLKEEVTGPLNVSVSGSGWGLASNSVHWLDLLSYLRPSAGYSIASGLSGPCPAKRPGHVEFFGWLKICDGGR